MKETFKVLAMFVVTVLAEEGVKIIQEKISKL